MTFERARVGDLLQLERRPVNVDLSSEYVEVGVRSFGKGIFHKEPIDGASLGNKRVFRIEPDDLVISNVFAWEGAIAIASDDERGTIGSHRFMTFVPADDRIDIRWASWFFRSEPGLELIRKASPGSAGRNRTLAIERFQALEITLPPVDEQRNIAARLDYFATASSNLLEGVARASELSDAVLVSNATRPDLTDEARRAAGWRQVTLENVLAPSGEGEPVDPSRIYQVAGVYSFGRGLIDRGQLSGADTSYKTLTRLRTNDVVFSKLGAWEGASALVTDEFDGYWVSSEFPVLRLQSDTLVPEFFSAILRSPDFWTAINAGTRGSMARRKRITPSEYLQTMVWLPSVEAQQEVVGIREMLDTCASHRSNSKERTEALLPAALNEAFAELT